MGYGCLSLDCQTLGMFAGLNPIRLETLSLSLGQTVNLPTAKVCIKFKESLAHNFAN